jgi:hypothetical protein
VRLQDGLNQKLSYGGGTPYSFHNEALWSLDEQLDYALDLPAYRDMFVQWGPFDFGDLAKRKAFAGLAVATDLNATATLRNLSIVHGATSHNYEMPVESGVNAHIFRTKAESAWGFSPALRLEDAGGIRAILRPPLQILVSGEKENPTR